VLLPFFCGGLSRIFPISCRGLHESCRWPAGKRGPDWGLQINQRGLGHIDRKFLPGRAPFFGHDPRAYWDVTAAPVGAGNNSSLSTWFSLFLFPFPSFPFCFSGSVRFPMEFYFRLALSFFFFVSPGRLPYGTTYIFFFFGSVHASADFSYSRVVSASLTKSRLASWRCFAGAAERRASLRSGAEQVL